AWSLAPADAERHTVHDDWHVASEALEHRAWTATAAHEILADALHPIDVEAIVEGAVVMFDAQAHSMPDVRPRRHVCATLRTKNRSISNCSCGPMPALSQAIRSCCSTVSTPSTFGSNTPRRWPERTTTP